MDHVVHICAALQEKELEQLDGERKAEADQRNQPAMLFERQTEGQANGGEDQHVEHRIAHTFQDKDFVTPLALSIQSDTVFCNLLNAHLLMDVSFLICIPIIISNSHRQSLSSL